LQDFLVDGIVIGHRPPWDGYRLLLKVPPAYRPRGNLLFSGCFMFLLTTEVDAVGILASFTDAL
jgi:hypothetical protein